PPRRNGLPDLPRPLTNTTAKPFEEATMKPRPLVSSIALTLFATLGIAVQTPAQTTQDQITTFDVPGASGGTLPISINPNGENTGYSFDVNGKVHGFLRAADGAITTIDVGPAGNEAQGI